MPTSWHKPVVSPSQLNMYLRCGEQYRRRYVEKDVIPPGIAIHKGSAVHKGAEMNFRQKIDSRLDMPSEAIVEVSVSTLEDKIRHEGLTLKREEETLGKGKVVGDAKDSVARLSELYSKKVAPKYQPTDVEISQTIELPDSPFDLYGILDLVDDEKTIVDLKTGTRSMTQEDADRSPQMSFYALSYKLLKGEYPRLVFEQLLDHSVPKNATILTHRGKDDSVALVNQINTMRKGVDAGVFPPAHPGSWWCSEKFCGYFTTCPYVKR